MARYPYAEWRGPVPAANYAPGQMGNVVGVTVHHMDGSLSSADGSFHDPARGASAHFGISYDGHVVQWVDTNDVAYHACRANWTGWIGIENESDPNLPDGAPTGAQIESMGLLIRWLGVNPVPAIGPESGGVGYHRQFGGPCSVGWGQTACPGQGFIDAIPAICKAAGAPSPVLGKKDDVIYKEETGTYWAQGLGDFYKVPNEVAVGHALNGGVVVPITTPQRVALGVALQAEAKASLTKLGLVK